MFKIIVRQWWWRVWSKDNSTMHIIVRVVIHLKRSRSVVLMKYLIGLMKFLSITNNRNFFVWSNWTCRPSLHDWLLNETVFLFQSELAEVNSMCADVLYCSTCACNYWMNAHMRSFLSSLLFFQGFMSCAALTNSATGRALLSEHLTSYTSIDSVLFFSLSSVWSLINFVCTTHYSSSYIYMAAGLLSVYIHIYCNITSNHKYSGTHVRIWRKKKKKRTMSLHDMSKLVMIEYEELKRWSKKNLKDENYLDLLNKETDSQDLLHLKEARAREKET